MPQLKDLTGLRVGKLMVIGRGEDKIAKSGKRLVQWECMCDCGRKTLVTTGHLQGEHTQSCGCMRKIACGKMGKATFVHGKENTKLYHTWMCMKSRCNNAANKRYRAYGERGIKICREWAESFTAFRDWALANGYRDDLTIDRIDVNGNYCPENCRWATLIEQANNKRNNHRIAAMGEEHTVAEWSRIMGISANVIHARLRHGWTEIRAVTTPLLRGG